jgi:polar amino acid transport system substrate-binding protein
MKKRIAVVVALAAVVCFVFSACGGGGGGASKLEQIKDSGKLVMYTNAEFPPYEFLGDGGQISGVDVEIGRAIAEKLGVELVVENAEFDSIVASISSGKGDIALTGLTVTAERKEEIDFSVPYVDSVQYLILPEGSEVAVMEDLENKSIGAQTGTTGEMLVQSEITEGVLKDLNVSLVQYKSAPTAMQDLISGRLEAIVIDELVALQIAQQNSGYLAIPFVYAEGTPVTEQFAAGIAKGNEDFLAVVDEVVLELLESGKIDEWFELYKDAE